MVRPASALLLCVLSVLVRPVIAAPAPSFSAPRLTAGQQDEAAFVAGLEEVRLLRERRRWAQARARLLELIGEHGPQDHVVHRVGAIREELQRCAVRAAVPRPEPEDLISGRLLRYSPSSGAIHLRYERRTLADFERHDDLRLHPLTFTGPYSIEIKGKRYAATPSGVEPGIESPVFLVCLRDEGFYQVSLGSYSETRFLESWTPAKIIAVVNEERLALSEGEAKRAAARAGSGGKVLDQVEKPENVRVGEEFTIKVSVGDTRIKATFNGRRLLSARKPKGQWGRVALAGLGSVEHIVIRGQANSSWIQGLIDALTREAELAFLARYDPDAELPPWLRGLEAPPIQAPEAQHLPWRFPRDQLPRVERISAMLRGGDFDKVLRELSRPGGDELQPDLRDYYRMHALLGLRLLDRAVEVSGPLAVRNPEYLPVRVLHAQILSEVGSYQAASSEFEELRRLDPTNVDVQRSLAEHYLLQGRLDDARALVLAARAAGTSHELIDQLDSTIVKAVRGPNWGRKFERETEHYRVVSDIDRRICVSAGRELEATHAACLMVLGAAPQAAGRSAVYLFSGEAGYEAYIEDLFDRRMALQNTAGIYSFGLKQLLIWNLPDRAAMMKVVRHEGVHQYLDRFPGRPPVWLHEGLAEYLALVERPRGTRAPRFGSVDTDHVRVLYRSGLVPLERFVRLDAERFYPGGERSYAQAWAFVHYLRHGEGHGELFEELLRAVASGEGTKGCVDRAFADVDFELLDAQLDQHLKSLPTGR